MESIGDRVSIADLVSERPRQGAVHGVVVVGGGGMEAGAGNEGKPSRPGRDRGCRAIRAIPEMTHLENQAPQGARTPASGALRRSEKATHFGKRRIRVVSASCASGGL